MPPEVQDGTHTLREEHPAHRARLALTKSLWWLLVEVVVFLAGWSVAIELIAE